MVADRGRGEVADFSTKKSVKNSQNWGKKVKNASYGWKKG